MGNCAARQAQKVLLYRYHIQVPQLVPSPVQLPKSPKDYADATQIDTGDDDDDD